jgi:hypothetical protein
MSLTTHVAAAPQRTGRRFLCLARCALTLTASLLTERERVVIVCDGTVSSMLPGPSPRLSRGDDQEPRSPSRRPRDSGVTTPSLGAHAPGATRISSVRHASSRALHQHAALAARVTCTFRSATVAPRAAEFSLLMSPELLRRLAATAPTPRRRRHQLAVPTNPIARPVLHS